MDALETKAKLRYIDPLPLYAFEKPYGVTIPFRHVPGAQRTNVSTSEHEVLVREMSGSTTPFSTDVQGFQVLNYPTKFTLTGSESDVVMQQGYYKECEELYKSCFGAKEVIIFDHMFRKAGIRAPPAEHDEFQRLLPPSLNVHVDQTPASARRRVRHHNPERASELLEGRVRILNIWRPLFSPLEHHPLALCDYRSLKPSDLVAADLLSPHYEGEMYHIRYSPRHQWWFKKSMQQREVMIIKCYDSDAEKQPQKVAKFTPHTAFHWDEGPENARPRESVEVRALVFS